LPLTVQSPTKFDIIEKVTDPLSPLLAAAEYHKNINSSFLPGSEQSGPHNKKIGVQRRLLSTKKKSIKKN
jgi:hypothetical protein